MSNRESGISLEQYQQLNHLLGLEVESPEASPEVAEQCGRVISLEDFRQSRALEGGERSKAASRAKLWLKVLAGLVKDYEAQMLAIANERPSEDWKQETGHDPYEQIAFDMERLEAFLIQMNWALEEGGAATLGEAWEILSKSSDEVLLGTLEYLATSSYLGFEVMHQVCQLGSLEAGQYVELDGGSEQILFILEQNQFIYSIAPLRNLQGDEAIAS